LFRYSWWESQTGASIKQAKIVIADVISPRNLTRFLQGGQVAQVAWGINLLLVIWVAYMLAELTWSLVPVPALQKSDQIEFKPARSLETVAAANYGQIAKWHLFGQTKTVVQTPERPIQAPETRLNLKLMGVLSSDEKVNAKAIIADPKGVQKSYGIGAQLPGDAELIEIHPDRVILLRNKRHETLRLERLVGAARGGAGSAPKARRRGAAKQLNEPARNLANTYKQQLESAPREVMKAVRPVPATRNGEFLGYRLGGARNNALLKSAGLMPGDIVTEVNGIKLNSAAKGLQAVERLRSVKRFNLTVLRGGKKVALAIELP